MCKYIRITDEPATQGHSDSESVDEREHLTLGFSASWILYAHGSCGNRGCMLSCAINLSNQDRIEDDVASGV